MAVTLQNLIDQVRDLIIEDIDDGETRYTDTSIIRAIYWALDRFAAHTALASATGYYPATGTEYDLPDNVLDAQPIDQCIRVELSHPYDGKAQLQPTYWTENINPIDGPGFYTLGKKLFLTSQFDEQTTMTVYYYAYYDKPLLLTETLQVPSWGIQALSYLVGASIMRKAATRAAGIRQWNTKTDSGNPIQNPLLEIAIHYEKAYEKYMANYPPQNRWNIWRT